MSAVVNAPWLNKCMSEWAYVRCCWLLLAFVLLQWITSKRQRVMKESNETNGTDEILKYAIQYAQDGSYHPNLTEDKKRAVRKRAGPLRRG